MESNSEDKNYDDISDVVERASASSDKDTYINSEESMEPGDNSYPGGSSDIATLDKKSISGAEENFGSREDILGNTKVFKWHWILVFVVSAVAIYISIANDAALEVALKRAFYSAVIFWIIAEVIDFIIYKMK